MGHHLKGSHLPAVIDHHSRKKERDQMAENGKRVFSGLGTSCTSASILIMERAFMAALHPMKVVRMMTSRTSSSDQASE
jgi:hypothetical protein